MAATHIYCLFCTVSGTTRGRWTEGARSAAPIAVSYRGAAAAAERYRHYLPTLPVVVSFPWPVYLEFFGGRLPMLHTTY